MEFSQLIEYKMKNALFEKLYKKCGGEASLSPFDEK